MTAADAGAADAGSCGEGGCGEPAAGKGAADDVGVGPASGTDAAAHTVDDRGREPDEWLHDPSCWGCGPQSSGGMGVRPRRLDDGRWVLHTTVDAAMHGPRGRVHGGLLAVPMDCLASWAAIDASRRRARAAGRDPDEVVPLTGSYEVRLRAATPTGVTLRMVASVGDAEGRRRPVHVEVRHGEQLTATFDAVFVEVPATMVDLGEGA